MAPKRKKQQAEKALVDEDELLSKVEDTTQVNKERIPEEIVDIRVKKGKTEYWIKWAGYDLRYRSWVPEESILDPRLIESFEEKCARNQKEEGVDNEKSPKAAEKTDEKKRRISSMEMQMSNGSVKVDKKGYSKTKQIIGKKQTQQTNEKQKLTTSKKIQKKEGTTAVKKQRVKKVVTNLSKEMIAKNQIGVQTKEKETFLPSKKIQMTENDTTLKKQKMEKIDRSIEETIERYTIKKIKGSEGETGSMPTTKSKSKKQKINASSTSISSSSCGATLNNSEKKRDVSSDGGDVIGNIESPQQMFAPPPPPRPAQTSQSPQQMLAPPRPAQTIPEQSMGQQKIQVVKRLDGSMQVRGLLPGQQLAQMPDGKLQVFSTSTATRQATPQHPLRQSLLHHSQNTNALPHTISFNSPTNYNSGMLPIQNPRTNNFNSGIHSVPNPPTNLNLGFGPIQNAPTNNHYAVQSVQSARMNYIRPIQNAPTNYIRPFQNAPTNYNSSVCSVLNAPTNFNSGLRPNYNVSIPFNPQRHIPVPLDRLNWPLMDRQYANVSDLNSPIDYSVIDQCEDGNSLFFEDTFDYTDLQPRE